MDWRTRVARTPLGRALGAEQKPELFDVTLVFDVDDEGARESRITYRGMSAVDFVQAGATAVQRAVFNGQERAELVEVTVRRTYPHARKART